MKTNPEMVFFNGMTREEIESLTPEEHKKHALAQALKGVDLAKNLFDVVTKIEQLSFPAAVIAFRLAEKMLLHPLSEENKSEVLGAAEPFLASIKIELKDRDTNVN